MINVDTDIARIYFRMTNTETMKSSLMSMGIDGSDLGPALSGARDVSIGFYAVSGDTIYFTDESRKLYSAGASGEGGKEAIEAPIDISAFNMSDEDTYFVGIEQDDGGKGTPYESIWRYSPGGDGEKLASGLAPGSPVNVVGDKIYFFERGEAEGETTLYRMYTDGTGKEAM
jgi:hypothetical protein